MVQKLAIAISGAVSLGSYESGVMYEIIEAIAQHNEHPDTTDDEKVEIDVISGASAGAMTACMLAQKLLFAADELRDPRENSLFRAWVEDVDIKDLLELRPGEDPKKSLFSSDLIAEIGKDHLLERYKKSVSKRSLKKHPAVAKELRLGIAMANLNGIDYKVKLTDFLDSNSFEESSLDFIYTEHQDRSIYILKNEGNEEEKDDNESLWKEIELRGRSSGAFPFAFRALPVERRKCEEVFRGSEFARGESDSKTYVYTDGGVFENHPLGMAKRLVNEIDKNPRDYENRFFLFIAPRDKQSEAIKLSPEEGDIIKTGSALLRAIFNQSRFQDWIKTSEINRAIERFDNQAAMLKAKLQDKPDQASAFEIVSDALLNVLYESTDSEDTSQNADRDRLKEQFHREFSELSEAHDEKLAETWLNMVLVLEKAADLGPKDLMRVYSITSDDVELGGEKLSAFAGFFKQEIREYDYDLGRKKARDFLSQLQELNHKDQQVDGHKHISLNNFTATRENKQFNVDIGKLTIKDLPLDSREAVRCRLLQRFGHIIGSLKSQSEDEKGSLWKSWLRSLGVCLLKTVGQLFFFIQLNKLLEISSSKRSDPSADER
jgi:hypothetical protein